jgi:hypothetical protein
MPERTQERALSVSHFTAVLEVGPWNARPHKDRLFETSGIDDVRHSVLWLNGAGGRTRNDATTIDSEEAAWAVAQSALFLSRITYHDFPSI